MVKVSRKTWSTLYTLHLLPEFSTRDEYPCYCTAHEFSLLARPLKRLIQMLNMPAMERKVLATQLSLMLKEGGLVATLKMNQVPMMSEEDKQQCLSLDMSQTDEKLFQVVIGDINYTDNLIKDNDTSFWLTELLKALRGSTASSRYVAENLKFCDAIFDNDGVEVLMDETLNFMIVAEAETVDYLVNLRNRL